MDSVDSTAHNAYDFSTHSVNEKGEFETSHEHHAFNVEAFIKSCNPEELRRLSIELRKFFPELVTKDNVVPPTPMEQATTRRTEEREVGATYEYRWYNFLIEMWIAFIEKITFKEKKNEK